MTAAPGKIPVLLTAVQVDLIGEALMEQISQLAYELSQSPQKGTSLEEASLLKAYLELAKIIMDRNGVHVRGEGTSGAPIRVTHARIDGPSPLQNPALRLRQP
ncbi:MAG: hypothetical protein JOY92_00205 [Verrucomicrobia bacterium]|nr:hypothetical protein [Verrucomicrobiota bacterium]